LTGGIVDVGALVTLVAVVVVVVVVADGLE
jgi:hypothetical protein